VRERAQAPGPFGVPLPDDIDEGTLRETGRRSNTARRYRPKPLRVRGIIQTRMVASVPHRAEPYQTFAHAPVRTAHTRQLD